MERRFELTYLEQDLFMGAGPYMSFGKHETGGSWQQ